MRRTLATTLAVATLALAACSSAGSGGDSGGSSVDAERDAPAVASAAEAGAGADTEAAYDAGDRSASVDTSRGDAAAEPERSIIATGDVALRSADVAQAVADVRRLVARAAGLVVEDRTDTDEEGEAQHASLVVRVPGGRFDDTMQALKGTATLVSAAADSRDVTTQVLDVDIRVRVQRRSIERIALLLDRAESIRDIVSIEAQLSRRQADLAALEQKQAALTSQTAMSTITVAVDRTRPAAAQKKTEEAGFAAGLDAGWDAFTAFGVGLATFLGAVLPWAGALALLAVPGVPILRRLRRRRSGAGPAPAAG